MSLRKQNKRLPGKQLAAIFIVGTVVLLGGYATWRVYQNHLVKRAAVVVNSGTRPQNSIDYSPATKTDNQSIDNRKQNNPTSVGTPLSQPPSQAPFTVTITRATTDTQNKQLIVGTMVSGTTSGTCVLSATRSGQLDVTATAEVTQQVNQYACTNFVIPFSKFPSSGDWNVSVTVTNNNTSKSAVWPQAVNVPKQS